MRRLLLVAATAIERAAAVWVESEFHRAVNTLLY
jgi:hypothetical protein